MEDLQIAYYLIVILIGFAALAIACFWAVKTHDVNLRNFCALYASFTLVLIFSVLKKYLALNVEEYTPQAWYVLSGISLAVEYSVIVFSIHFLLGVYQVQARRLISSVFFITMLICVGLMISPLGARLDAENKIIQFGIGMEITGAWYFTSFSIAILIGFGFLKRIWNTQHRNLVIGSLIFAGMGYIETLLNFSGSLRTDTVEFKKESVFLYSSLPYVIYGFFLIYYFLHFSPPIQLEHGQVSENFISAYKITERERELILMVIQGKSNADIAKELFISLATVKTHLHNIYQKVEVKSRFDLLARVRLML